MAAQEIWLREDMAVIHAGVEAFNLPGVASWASMEGGIPEASSVFTRPGGMLPGLQIGGIVERSDVTVTRQFTRTLATFIKRLDDECGNGAAWVEFRMLDRNKQQIGPWIHYNGILKSVVRTNLDANNSAAAFLGLVIALDEESVSNNSA